MSASDRIGSSPSKGGTAFFGGEAAGQQARFFVDHDRSAALAAARRNVATDPVDQPASSLLGSAWLGLNEPQRALAAYQVAGTLGWRDIPTDLYWIVQSQFAGDVDAMARYMDAVLRLNTDIPVVQDMLDRLAGTADGRAALVDLLKKNPPWQDRFLRNVVELNDDEFAQQLAIIAQAAREGAALDCQAAAWATNQLIQDNRFDQAHGYWRATCGRRSGTGISDGNFESGADTSASTPFAWHYRYVGGLDAKVEAAPPPLNGHALRIDSDLSTRVVAAYQAAFLEPGTYKLTWRTALNDGKLDNSIAITATCTGSNQSMETSRPQSSGSGNRLEAQFSVPAEGCPVQTIAIQKDSNLDGQANSGWIDDISIRKLG